MSPERKEYIAKVALVMLPIMYRQVSPNGALVSGHSKIAVEAAVEIGELLADRIGIGKGGDNAR